VEESFYRLGKERPQKEETAHRCVIREVRERKTGVFGIPWIPTALGSGVSEEFLSETFSPPLLNEEIDDEQD
jgi:hypothetical protein